MKRYLGVTVTILFLVFFSGRVFAESEYVLPYPSLMPGHPFYKASEFIDQVQEWWSFGSFAKIKYHTSISDKKLIEAKTLFEYKQYLLGYKALQVSNEHFYRASLFIKQAAKENKNTTEKRAMYKMEALRHIEIFNNLKTEVPKEFLWEPEKASSTTLKLQEAIEESIDLRKKQI